MSYISSHVMISASKHDSLFNLTYEALQSLESIGQFQQTVSNFRN